MFTVNQEIHLGSEVDGSWAVPNPITAPNERRDHRMEAISKTDCRDVLCLASHFATDNATGGQHAEEDATVNEEMLANDMNSSIDTWIDIEPEAVRGTIGGPEYQPSWWGTFEREDDDVSLRQGLLPSEEVPMLLTEVVPDYENPQQHYAHCAVSPSTRISGDPQPCVTVQSNLKRYYNVATSK